MKVNWGNCGLVTGFSVVAGTVCGLITAAETSGSEEARKNYAILSAFLCAAVVGVIVRSRVGTVFHNCKLRLFSSSTQQKNPSAAGNNENDFDVENQKKAAKKEGENDSVVSEDSNQSHDSHHSQTPYTQLTNT